MVDAPFTVTRAGTNDLVLARQAIADVHERPLVDEMAIKSFLNDPACYLILAVEGGRVLGSLNGYSLRRPHQSKPQFLLYEIDVSATDRGRGIGRALVTAFTAEARATGAAEIWVLTNESNQAALDLYSKCGYCRVNEDDVMLSLAIEDDVPETGTTHEF